MADAFTIAASPATIPELIASSGEHFGDVPVIVHDDVSWTFGRLDAAARAVARALVARGCGKGTRVGILLPNGSAWVAAFLGITRIGAVAVPVSTLSTPRELGWIVRHADLHTLVMCEGYRNQDYLAALEQVAPSLRSAASAPLRVVELPYLRHVLMVGDRGTETPWCEDLDLADPSDAPPDDGVDDDLLAALEAQVTPADLALVIYTSGSMDVPKGVVHTQGTIVRKSGLIAHQTDRRPGDRFYTNMPFFWVGGLMIGVLASLYAGSSLHCTVTSDPARLLALLEDEQITTTTIFSPGLPALLGHPDFDAAALGAVREFGKLGGGGALGMTETFGMHSLYPPGAEASEGGMGVGVPGVERQIHDPVTGEALPPGHLGELVVRGEFVMDGYYKRERHQVFRPDGWFRTGDLCSISEGGEVFWSGRLDGMIKTSGANVSPLEVESVILTWPGIGAAAVVGVPDAKRGTKVVAAVEATEGATVDVDDLQAFLRQELAGYKVPVRIEVLPPGGLPRGATGKIQAGKVRDLLETPVPGIESQGQ